MVEERILICDEDQSYVEALTRYLIGCDPELKVHSYTDVQAFELDSEYGVGLLSKHFLEKYERMEDREKVHHVLYMTEGAGDAFGEYRTIYKFQAMDKFRKIFVQEQWQLKSEEKKDVPGGTRFIAIYSPMSHELLLPFTLLLAQQYAKDGRTLLVDMQENSMLMNLLQLKSKKTMIDYIYYLESEKQKRAQMGILPTEQVYPGELQKYIEMYEDIAILPPVRIPSEIAYVTADEWSELLTGLRGEGFRTVILLFDRIHCGFEQMLLECEQLILVGKQGGFYKSREEKLLTFLKVRGMDKITKQIYLPIAVDPIGEEYQMEGFVQGPLGNFIRSQSMRIVGGSG
jgi:hypothetical protein